MSRLIKIGSFALLAVALVLGVLVGLLIFYENSTETGVANQETTVQLVTEEQDKDKDQQLVEQDYEALKHIFDRRLSALDVAKVNEILKDEIPRVLGAKKLWNEDDLVSALLPHAHEAVIQWLEDSIHSLALENDFTLSRRDVRDFRDAYMLSEWPLFMVYYQIAYLKRVGFVVLE
jgi:hypothetical protein